MEPIFIRNADMPEEDTAPITVYEALSNSFGATNIEGIQRIAGLWRIYMKNKAKRLDIITKQTVVINEKHVRLYDENPFNNNQKNEKRDKLTVRGLPLSVNNDEIKQIANALLVPHRRVMDIRAGYRDQLGILRDLPEG